MDFTSEKGLSYQLNEKDFTASVDVSWMAKGNLIIPHYITHESQKYIIVKISENSFKENHRIRSIKFEKGSELRSIDKNAFYGSSIQMISIPNKTSKIGQSAFYGCKNLKKVEISPDSELQTIEKEAFSYSSITALSIPKKVTEIGESTFSFCNYLQSIQFTNDSSLHSIGNEAFSNSSLSSISIPSQVEQIGFSCFKNCMNFQCIEFSEDSKLQSIEFQAFANSSLKSIRIPKSVKRIESSSFSMCKFIEKVEFSENSELNYIGEFAFYNTSLASLVIPPHVTQIKDSTFSSCENLKFIEFSENSELKLIEKDAFFASSIRSLSIPESLQELQDGWCNCTFKLKNVKIDKKNEKFFCIENDQKLIACKSGMSLNSCDVILFARRDIEYSIVPSFVSVIGSFAYSGCLKLKYVEFCEGSQLQRIENDAFSHSSIRSISIPDKVCQLNERVFFWCKIMSNIELLSDRLYLSECFDGCENLSLVSFPNATFVFFESSTFSDVSDDLSLFVLHHAKIEISEAEDPYEIACDVSFF